MSTNRITWHLRKHEWLAPCMRREHVPRAVVVAEEEKCYQTIRSQHVNAYITPPVKACSTESGYPNRRLPSGRQPFFNLQTQGPFGGVHPRLLQPCRRWFGRASLHSARRSLGHKESGHFTSLVLGAIQRSSGGYPRNVACDSATPNADMNGPYQISDDGVRGAAVAA